MNKEVMFSSSTGEWSTPQLFYDKLNEEFHFTLDPCATPDNAKCQQFFTKSDDGLKKEWHKYSKSVFMNPPYGRNISTWVKKAYDESLHGVTVVCLLPSRTDTKWMQEAMPNAKIVCFVKGRLKFGGSNNSAPFPSVIILFSNTITHSQVSLLSELGIVMTNIASASH